MRLRSRATAVHPSELQPRGGDTKHATAHETDCDDLGWSTVPDTIVISCGGVSPFRHRGCEPGAPSIRSLVVFVRRKFANFVKVFFENILTRDHNNLDPKPSCDPSVWVAGFPCKPFSWLRCGETDLLLDKEAQVLHECIKVLKALHRQTTVLRRHRGHKRLSHFINIRVRCLTCVQIEISDLLLIARQSVQCHRFSSPPSAS